MTPGSVSSLSPNTVTVPLNPLAQRVPQRVVVAQPFSSAQLSQPMAPQVHAMPTTAAYYHPAFLPQASLGSPAATSASAANAAKPHVAFGSCICPICASMAIIVETHSSIKRLESGDGIVPGETMSKITAKTGFNYIPHERATRLEAPAVSDVQNIERAAMTRVAAPGGRELLEIPNEKSLYSTVSASLMMANHKVKDYAAHRNDILYSPMSGQAVGNTLKALTPGRYQVMSILHHLQNADDRVTKPISIGYMMTGVVNPAQKELAVMSVRPLPKMENMNAGPAGLANLLAHLTTEPKAKYDSLAVAVEAGQDDMKRYLEGLKQVGVDVKRYARVGDNQKPNGVAIAEMPKVYETELPKLYPGVPPALYAIDVAGLRKWAKEGLPPEAKAALAKLNPDLPASLAALQKDQKTTGPAMTPEAMMTVLAPPPPPGSRRPLPREEELGAH